MESEHGMYRKWSLKGLSKGSQSLSTHAEGTDQPQIKTIINSVAVFAFQRCEPFLSETSFWCQCNRAGLSATAWEPRSNYIQQNLICQQIYIRGPCFPHGTLQQLPCNRDIWASHMAKTSRLEISQDTQGPASQSAAGGKQYRCGSDLRSVAKSVHFTAH